MNWARTEKLAKLLLHTLQDGTARNDESPSRKETLMNDQTPEIPPIPDQTQTGDGGAAAAAQPSDVPPADASQVPDHTQAPAAAPDAPPVPDHTGPNHTGQDIAQAGGAAPHQGAGDRSDTLSVLHDAAQLAQFLSENPDVLKFMNALVDAAQPSTQTSSTPPVS